MADAREAERAGAPVSERILRVFAWGFFVLAVLFAGVAAAVGDTFYLRLATEALIFGGLALAVDILLGFTGLLSLGQALFFGYGAYVCGLVLKEVAPSFWLAMGVVLVTATLFGLIAGAIAIRARGVYFALITFGLAQVVSRIVFNVRALGASDGLIGIPAIEIDMLLFRVSTSDAAGFFLFVLAIVLGLYVATAYVMATPFGRTLLAIRTNETRVPFLGFRPWRYKLAAFVLAADIAALCGALYPMLRGFVSPELLFFQVSGNAVITVVLGGVGTLVGALYGAAILTVLKSVVGTITEHHQIVIGLLFVLSVIVFPRGLIGHIGRFVERVAAGKSGGRR